MHALINSPSIVYSISVDKRLHTYDLTISNPCSPMLVLSSIHDFVHHKHSKQTNEVKKSTTGPQCT